MEHCSTDGKGKTMKVERKSREVTYNENRKDNEIEHGGLSRDKTKKGKNIEQGEKKKNKEWK